MNSCNEIEVADSPLFEVDFEGGSPLEVAVGSGFSVECVETEMPLAEVSLIDGGIIPEGETMEWEHTIDFCIGEWVFVYVGPALADIDATWATDAWFRTDGWFRSEAW